MSTTFFSVQEHTLPCTRVRGYNRATIDANDEQLYLAVKQYTPLDNLDPRPGDITILGAHANGFPKELYEPLWDELYHDLKQKNLRIRSIWISDVAWQGYSSVLNEGALGDDPNWLDHSRDLFLLVNHFSTSMPHPIVGIGHSMGGAQITNLSLLHPRLFTSLILIDPVIARSQGTGNYLVACASATRRDLWPSRQSAQQSFQKSKFYQSWDPRVLDLWVQHGLRDTPTALYPDTPEPPSTDRPVTLRTTKHEEVFSFIRPKVPGHADLDPASFPKDAPFYRPEPGEVFLRLPHVRPSVLYIFGAKSNLSTPLLRAEKLAATGSGVGGSGGKKQGRVREVLVDAGHLVAMEKVGYTALAASRWIEEEVRHWKDDEVRVRGEVEGTPRKERSRLSQGFLTALKGDWTKASKL